MGRLVYVREVRLFLSLDISRCVVNISYQDREAEPRFTGPPSGGRGGYEGGPRGGYGGGFGGGPMGASTGGGGRQIYVSNVCVLSLPYASSSCVKASC